MKKQQDIVKSHIYCIHDYESWSFPKCGYIKYFIVELFGVCVCVREGH